MRCSANGERILRFGALKKKAMEGGVYIPWLNFLTLAKWRGSVGFIEEEGQGFLEKP